MTRMCKAAIVVVTCLIGCSDPVTPPEGDSTSAGGHGGSGAGGAGGTGGTGGSDGGAPQGGGGSGGGPTPCASLSDDFEDPASLSCWSQRHLVEGTDPQFDLLDVDASVAGHLVIRPTASGWYGDDVGPLVFKLVSGDFVVEVEVGAYAEGTDDPPADPYHSGGLLVRSPSSAPGDQDWLMYNVGYQESFVGTEGKTTEDSMSILTLLPNPHRGRLRICRVGDSFTMWKWLEGETEWTQEHAHTRGDLPDALQVGMITNAWPPTSPPVARDVEARFASIAFGVVTSEDDCDAPIEPR